MIRCGEGSGRGWLNADDRTIHRAAMMKVSGILVTPMEEFLISSPHTGAKLQVARE